LNRWGSAGNGASGHGRGCRVRGVRDHMARRCVQWCATGVERGGVRDGGRQLPGAKAEDRDGMARRGFLHRLRCAVITAHTSGHVDASTAHLVATLVVHGHRLTGNRRLIHFGAPAEHLTSPSTGILSPGLTSTTSPTATSDTNTRSLCPSLSTVASAGDKVSSCDCVPSAIWSPRDTLGSRQRFPLSLESRLRASFTTSATCGPALSHSATNRP
jgi:hypothetical protein